MPVDPLEELSRQCKRWNTEHQIGTAVTVLLDSGQLFDTLTRSAAQILSGHTAVIYVEGISGCYLLERVKPRGAHAGA